MIFEILEEPLTFSEAYINPRWKEAIIREVDSLKYNKTWTIVDRFEGCTTILAKWLFKVKKRPSGELVKFKVRLVARDFQQTHGVDYLIIFTLVVHWSTIRFILSLTAKRNWTLQL
jgi:hypothetical protein